MKDEKQTEPSREWCLEMKPRGYFPPERVTPGRKGRRHVIHVGRAERRLAEAAPESSTPDLTGRYQDGAAQGLFDGPQFLMHINQAGKHIEGLMVMLPANGGDGQEYRFSAEVGGGDVKLEFFVDSEFVYGKLTPGADFHLVEAPLPGFPDLLSFKLREPTSSFIDSSLEFVLEQQAEQAGERSDSHDVARSAELMPLTDAQMMRVRSGLAPELFKAPFEKYNEHASTKQSYASVYLARSAERVDALVKAAVDESAVPAVQHPQLFDFVRTVLLSHALTVSGVRKSQLQWIEDMVARVEGEPSLRPDIPTLRRLLGRVAGEAGKLFEYEIEVDLKAKAKGPSGLPLNGFFYWGTITVRALNREDWGASKREREGAEKEVKYDACLGGIGAVLGKGAGAPIKGKANIASLEDWTPADFHGPIRLSTFSGGVGAKVGQSEMTSSDGSPKKVGGTSVGASIVASGLVILGSQTHQRLIMELPVSFNKRGGIGAEGAIAFGQIFAPKKTLDSDYSRNLVTYGVPVGTHDENEVHFKFGSSILEASGRRLVRGFCACWLRWLDSAESELRVVGHADSVDTPQRNLELSRLRAANVVQAMKDALGSKLKVPEQKIKIQPWGECDAYLYGEKDLPNRRFRRVDVILDGRCVLTLWGA